MSDKLWIYEIIDDAVREDTGSCDDYQRNRIMFYVGWAISIAQQGHVVEDKNGKCQIIDCV